MFKYQSEIEALNDCAIICPPTNIYPFQGLLFRYVHNSECENSRNNNLPVKKKSPNRMIDNDDFRCLAVASLSCFDTYEQALEFFEHKLIGYPNIAATLGCCIGQFVVNDEHGARTESNVKGHFSFFEYEDTNLESLCETITNIAKCNP